MKIKANKTLSKIVSAILAVLLAGMVSSCGTGGTARSGGSTEPKTDYSGLPDTSSEAEPVSGTAETGKTDVSTDPETGETSSGSESEEDAISDEASTVPVETAADTEEETVSPGEDASGGSGASAETGDGNFLISTEDGTVTKSGSVYTVTSAGTYTVSGTLSDGQIIVDAGDGDEVEIDLSGATISCSYDSPIYAKNADKVKIKAVAGTVNTVTDARTTARSDSDTAGAAAVYALCDLNLIGTGTLNVVANKYNNGIHTKDDLKIKNLTLSVSAPGNALKGNDSVTIESGAITVISTAGDGIKTDNSDVSSKGVQRGTVTISGGTVTIYAACDGIDAAYDVVIDGEPAITVYTHSYSSYTVSSAKTTTRTNGVTKSTNSSKGIKADDQVTVSGGTIVIKCMDDGIHANSDVTLENGSSPLGNITVNGGSITVTAADDGIHADGTLHVTGGYIDIVNSHEGLEGHYITVDDGEIHVYATDDGVNATSSGSRSLDGLITVNGGKMIVEVGGQDVDGVDSNGSYRQTGGFVVISNPNADSSGNMSAVDVDGTVTVTGGVIIALGIVPGNGGGMGGMGGMGGGRFGMGGMSSSSTLPSGYVTFSGTLSAGTHTFTFGSTGESFTLKSKVSGGWIWASGISSSNYTLK